MSDEAPDEDGHADNIIGDVSYEAAMPTIAKEFLPWHRPRKQYVRDRQWCAEINRLHEGFPFAGDVLKYLGLPGVDLLDLRHFHSAVCIPNNLTLRFLGFNSSAKPASKAQTELNISLDEVRRLPSVDPLSDVIGDNFALVANDSSIASRRTRELGPFDVINLDLCDGFGAHPPAGALKNSYYDAVSSLFALQAHTKHPWLLLLTTRADKANINSDVLQALVKKYMQNLTHCDSFREASRDSFNIETGAALQAAVSKPDGLVQVFLTGLCKWFATLALQNQPPTNVEVRSVIGYSVDVGSEQEDLISIAIKFTPTFVPAKDPLGLANRPAAAPDECKISTRALKCVAKRINVDKKLAEDAELHQSMVNATAHLLGLARYDITAYKAWLAKA